MPAIVIRKESIDFLKTLSKNNNREWFHQNKGHYIKAQNNIIEFADALLVEMNKHDKIETPSGKKSLFRIYKDVRFAKDKTPYNIHWSGAFKRATKKLRGGYYFQLKPGNSFLAGGFWGPEPDDMKRIRHDIASNEKGWRKMLADKTLVTTFGKMTGQKLSTTPRSYPKDHPAIDLLRHKQFLLKFEFTDKEVISQNYLLKMNDTFKKMRPFLNFMSEVLTADANGESIVG